MSLFGDNQTRHLYVVAGSNGVAKKALKDSDLFRMNIHQGGNAAGTASNVNATTDVINSKLIKKVTVSPVKPVYLRKWTVEAPTSVAADTTYYLYFYLENLMGFGMQDRVDRVAAYTSTGTTVATVMQHLAVDLFAKLCMAGPLANASDPTRSDFTVSYGGTLVTKANVIEKTLPVAASGTDIVVTENSLSETFQWNEGFDLAMRMHTNPYAYNVTMSTGKQYLGNSETPGSDLEPWSDAQKQIFATDTTTVYISSLQRVQDMEHYFGRNRADLYDLTPGFNTAIINKLYSTTAAMAEKPNCASVDVHYAFSDEQGYTYHSDKDLTIIVGQADAVDGNYTAFVKSNANSANALIKNSDKYYIFPEGHTANAEFDDTPKVEIKMENGKSIQEAYKIAAMFK